MKIEITSEDRAKIRDSLKATGKILFILAYIVSLVCAILLLLGGPAAGNWALALAGLVLVVLTIFVGVVFEKYGLI